jgi:predicted Zn-ribbon and HTH transcriptional regulator
MVPTTRERLAAVIRDSPATPSDLSREVGTPESVVYDHLRHVAQSLEDEQLLVAPPTCRACGFDGFDDPLGRPSRCPVWRSERLTEPRIRID